MTIDLFIAKDHLRVDNAAEDELIQNMIDAAEAAALNYLNLETLPEAAPVQAAVLMLIGALYANREAQSERPLVENRLFTQLLNPYRLMVA
ncbi:MAG: phage gp6-like head-tail connector protein [Comamonadaceae bacterium]|nr:phage gp6-like head-tail connector protein [Comamonadaceae bacterium]